MKTYEKPMAEVIDFNVCDTIMEDVVNEGGVGEGPSIGGGSGNSPFG